MTTDISCPICMEEFDIPRVIPCVANCGHTLCGTCAHHIFNSTINSAFICPTCKARSQYPIPKNFMLITFLQYFRAQQHGDSVQFCNIPPGSSVSSVLSLSDVASRATSEELKLLFHTGIYANGQWTCCNKSLSERGCQMDIYKSYHSGSLNTHNQWSCCSRSQDGCGCCSGSRSDVHLFVESFEARDIMKGFFIFFRGEVYTVTREEYLLLRSRVRTRENERPAYQPPYQPPYQPVHAATPAAITAPAMPVVVPSPSNSASAQHGQTQQTSVSAASQSPRTTATQPLVAPVVIISSANEVHDLRRRVAARDPYVDTRAIETYFTDEGFTEVFGMSKNGYLRLPAWKRVLLRRRHELF
jgi:hypothetical protein